MRHRSPRVLLGLTLATIATALVFQRVQFPPGRPKLSWKSDPLVVLGARESRAQGEAAEQVEELGQGPIPHAQK